MTLCLLFLEQRQAKSRHEELKERARLLLEAARKEAAMKKVVTDAVDSGRSPTSEEPHTSHTSSPSNPNAKPLSEVS